MNLPRPHEPGRTQTHKQDRRARIGDGLLWLTLLAALLYVLACYGPGHARDEVFYNADAMFIPVFFRDVMARGTLAGWDLPTSPFFFPDMALFFPALAAIPDIRYATLTFGALQLLLLGGGLLALQHQLFGPAAPARRVLLLTLTLCLLLIATDRLIVYPYALMSVHHMGVLMVAIWATVALLHTLNPAHNIAVRVWWALLLMALTLLTALSETLFSVQFVVPALLVVLLWGKSKQVAWRAALSVAGGLLLSALAGQMLRQLWVSIDKVLLYANTKDGAIAEAWTNFAAWIGEVVHDDPYFVVAWIVSTAALLATFFIALRQRHGQRTLAPLRLVAALCLAAMGISLAAAVFSGNFLDIYSTRYIIPTVYLPLLTGVPLLVGVWPGSAARAMVAWATNIAAGFALVYMLVTLPPLSPAALAAFAHYQDPFMACLQQATAQRDLRYGLAGFWQAASSTALAEGQLEVVAVEPNLAPVLWNNNRARYQAPFEFVITGEDADEKWRVPPALVMQRFGAPDDEFTCAGNRVLVYDRGDVLVSRWFSHHPAFAQLDQVGATAEFYGYTMPSLIEGMGVGLSLAASEQWDQQEGTLAYAPLTALPAGSYAVALDVYTDNANVGSWEAVAITPAARDLLGASPITATGSSVITGSFDLKTEANVDVVVKYNGHGALYVDRMRVARVAPGEAAQYVFAEPPMPASAAPPTLHLIYPTDSSRVGSTTDFVWQWTGEPLPTPQTFEVRLWPRGEATHYGAHDAAATRGLIRRIGDTYMLHLDLGGAYAVMQQGAGEYAWTVAVVAVDPAYQDLQIEAAPHQLYIQP